MEASWQVENKIISHGKKPFIIFFLRKVNMDLHKVFGTPIIAKNYIAEP
jgi:hypothetical protein